MADYVKHENFVEDLAAGVHRLVGSPPPDAVSIYLSNATPNAATHEVKANVAEIATGNGYTGPESVSPVGARSGGTFTLSGDQVVVEATGEVGPFRYVLLFNDTPTDPEDPIIAHWDHGEAVTLQDGETFTWRPDGEESGGTIFTLA